MYVKTSKCERKLIQLQQKPIPLTARNQPLGYNI